MHDQTEHPATANLAIWHIAIPAPLHKGFDYHAPRQLFSPPAPGIRVFVPFGRRKTVGILHNGSLYRLQATKLGKLILTK